jgi:hypothetical protein
MYVYIQTEPTLFTVGFHSPSGKWHPESDHPTRKEAAQQVAKLNGTAPPPAIDKELLPPVPLLLNTDLYDPENFAWLKRIYVATGGDQTELEALRRKMDVSRSHPEFIKAEHELKAIIKAHFTNL